VLVAGDPPELGFGDEHPAAVQRRIAVLWCFTLRWVWRTISIIDSHGGKQRPRGALAHVHAHDPLRPRCCVHR
jgi:hypothetical protein